MILHHDNCYDGAGAAWVARKWAIENNHAYALMPQRFDNPPPIFSRVAPLDIYVVDFSYPREVIEAWRSDGHRVTVIDHHKTAEAALKDLPGTIFDMERSGTILTWYYFYPAIPPPRILEYIQDRDLWQFKLPESRRINAYIQTFPSTIDGITEVIERFGSADGIMVQRGEGALAYLEAYTREMVTNVQRLVKMPGFETKIPVLNVPYKGTSEVVGAAAIGRPFAVGWHQTKNGKYIYSLRSDVKGSNFDVAEFAKSYGGGGHRNAAGFVSDRQLW